jgi:peroxiredoxin
MKLDMGKGQMRRHIGVLGIWLLAFGILILTLPFLIVLPTGYNIALSKSISHQEEHSLTTPADVNSINPIAPVEEALPSVENTVDISTAINAATLPDHTLTSHQEPVTNMPTFDGMAQIEAASSQGDKVAAILSPTVKVGTDIGNLAPDFTLKTISGESITLSDLRGKKVMLNFWATYCGACIVGFPLTRETYVKHGNNSGDIAVITVCIDARVDRIKAIENKYGDKYGPLDFPILLDEQTKTKNDYHIWAVPTTFFIDSQGIIKQMKPGRFQSQQEIEDMLKSLD